MSDSAFGGIVLAKVSSTSDTEGAQMAINKHWDETNVDLRVRGVGNFDGQAAIQPTNRADSKPTVQVDLDSTGRLDIDIALADGLPMPGGGTLTGVSVTIKDVKA
jgi:hypothetical protein